MGGGRGCAGGMRRRQCWHLQPRPAVANRVVRPAGQPPRDLEPLVSQLRHPLHDHVVLCPSPRGPLLAETAAAPSAAASSTARGGLDPRRAAVPAASPPHQHAQGRRLRGPSQPTPAGAASSATVCRSVGGSRTGAAAPTASTAGCTCCGGARGVGLCTTGVGCAGTAAPFDAPVPPARPALGCVLQPAPAVADGVVRPSRQLGGDDAPSAAKLLHAAADQLVLVRRPLLARQRCRLRLPFRRREESIGLHGAARRGGLGLSRRYLSGRGPGGAGGGLRRAAAEAEQHGGRVGVVRIRQHGGPDRNFGLPAGEQRPVPRATGELGTTN